MNTVMNYESIFERYGEISHFCFVGKDFHIGRGFLKYKSQDSKDECLQMAGYNDFTKPEYVYRGSEQIQQGSAAGKCAAQDGQGT